LEAIAVKKHILFTFALILLAAFSPSDLSCQQLTNDPPRINKGVGWPRDFAWILTLTIDNCLNDDGDFKNNPFLRETLNSDYLIENRNKEKPKK